MFFPYIFFFMIARFKIFDSYWDMYMFKNLYFNIKMVEIINIETWKILIVIVLLREKKFFKFVSSKSNRILYLFIIKFHFDTRLVL